MTKDLTEQWKKGELESGWYYIEEINGDVQIDYYDVACVDYEFNELEGDWDNFGETIKKVLAPVPTYEEWQHQQMSLRMTIDDYKNVVDICEQLKELLKGCREVIYNLIDDEPCCFDHHGYCQTHGWMSVDICSNEQGKELLTKIDEVLK